MKYGDRIEWRGLSKNYGGIVAKGEDGQPIVKMDDGKSFPLKDVINSPSLKVTMVWFLSA